MPKLRANFTVVLTLPEGATAEEARDYLLAAITNYRHVHPTETPMAGVDGASVTVTLRHVWKAKR